MPQIQRSRRELGFLYDDFTDNPPHALARDPIPVAEDAPLDRTYRFFRPPWRPMKGSPTLQNNSAEFSANTKERLAHPMWKTHLKSLGAVGVDTWEVDVQFGADPGSGTPAFRLVMLWGGTNKSWRADLDHDGSIALQKDSSDVATGSVSAPGTGENTFKVTRDSSDEWEIFWNGSSVLTHTESQVQMAWQMWLEADADAKTSINRIEIY